MIDKKTLPVIIVLVILVLFWFQIMEYLGFYEPTRKQQPVEEPAATADTAEPIPFPGERRVLAPSDTLRMAERLVTDSAVSDTALPVAPDTIVLKTETYTAVLSSFGGGPVSLKLNEYTYRDGEPIEMLPEAEYATPEATFAGGTFSTSRVDFRSSLEPGVYEASDEPFDIVYSYGEPGQGEVRRSYRFYPNDYHFDLVIEVVKPDQLGFERQYRLIWNTPLGVTEPQPETDYDAMEAAAMMGGSRTKLDNFENGRLNQSETGYTSWAGIRSKYFAAVLIPSNRNAEGVVALGDKEKISTPKGSVERRRIMAGVEMLFANVGAVADTFRVFVGPLDYTLMSEYGVDLEDMLGIGTMPVVGWLIKPFALAIIWLLPKIYTAVPNYGMVIIIFALLVKVITLPLSMKSFKSMNAMRQLQPEMEKLKERHKKNPQQLNAEMMKLYKKHGVNPMSGCLPMLPQMPLFFALFSVFRSTILLRDAPFFWFISDLSRGATSVTDPYIILVVIMVAMQFVSQKFTMASATQQNKIFMFIFPLFMGFLLYRFPAGLVLYWTCYSAFSLLDYALFKRSKNPQVKTA